MTTDSVFITTTIPFVNGAPHVGFAWELILADVLARYHRARGARVFFLTGTDDNSLKNVRAAEQVGRPTAEFVEAQGERFHGLTALLGLSNNGFIRTAFDPRHAPAVDKIWRRCQAAGDVYRRAYAGLYCVGCEQFYAPDELVDGACPDHETPLETVNESNYFFALSRYQALLESKLLGGGLKVLPDSYLKESSQWLQRGLVDFSISRSHERARGWGVAVAEDPTQVVYVWFDALTNYLSGLGYAEDADDYRDFWRLSQRRIHVVGKNVTRFHCIYWPAILASAGLAAPTEVVVHGFLTADGRKIGKSLGNGVDPFALVDEVGRDRLRYYLLRHFPLGRDGDFSRERLVVGCNAALSDQLGNLLSRVVTLVSRECGGRVPTGDPTGPLQGAAERATEQAVAELEACAPDRALAAVLSLVEASNALLARVEPWRLATLRRAQPPVRPTSELTCEIEACLAEVCRALLWAAGLLAPFLPDTAERIAGQLGAPAAPAYRCAVAQVWSSLGRAACVERGEALFARL